MVGEEGVNRLGPRERSWEERVVEEGERKPGPSFVEAGLASLQGGAPQPWWEQEEEVVPRVEAWTRPSRTGRKRRSPGMYEYGPQDRGGSREDNFGRGWGSDPGLGPPESRRQEVQTYSGEVARVEQAIKGGRISYPARPSVEQEPGENSQLHYLIYVEDRAEVATLASTQATSSLEATQQIPLLA